jgi:AcrR family transcriptional regulator
MPRAFTEREKELIGRRLLEQGHRLFSAYGLKKTNVEEIARAAGISKGAFYSFYESKEALFMDVIEQSELRVRQQLLAMIDLPGPSPRARLLAVLKKAFALFKAIPILQFLTGSDYDLLFRRLPAEKFQAHVDSDRAFFEAFIARCRKAGIAIQAPGEQIMSLLYPLVIAHLHEEGLGRNHLPGSMDLLLELVAAFCLGEVELQLQEPARPEQVSSVEGSRE